MESLSKHISDLEKHGKIEEAFRYAELFEKLFRGQYLDGPLHWLQLRYSFSRSLKKPISGNKTPEI